MEVKRYKFWIDDDNYSMGHHFVKESNYLTLQAERDALQWRVKELEECSGMMCAYSNAVSMALRSPGGRTHSWTIGKISHLYDQQCKMEAILAKKAPL